METYRKADLKIVAWMKKILDKESAMKTKGIYLPGDPVIFSDFFINAISVVAKEEKEKMEFYFYALRPEVIEKTYQIEIEFDYSGNARKIHEIKNWPEIEAAIMQIDCGPYILQKISGNYRKNGDKYKVKIGYKIKKNENFKKEPGLKKEIPTGSASPMETEIIKKEKQKNSRR